MPRPTAIALGFAVLLGALAPLLAAGQDGPTDERFDASFVDPALAARYDALNRELRCLVCQNQSIADSHAPLATDLRHQVHDMLLRGASDAEIVQFMTARYGDYVLYKPPLSPLTVLLWLGPFLLLGVAATLWWRAVLRRAALPDEGSSTTGDR
jgi:cytochrome c-type biogenesis protein CcmH